MARVPSLSGTPSDPFGSASYSGGFSFGSLDPSRKQYLAFQKVQTDYQLGRATSDEYLAAYKAYVDATAPNTTTRYNAEASYADAVYTIARNQLVFDIQTDKKTIDDLIVFDQAGASNLDPTTAIYQQRMNNLWSSEGQKFSDAENEIRDGLSNGTMTWTQALNWYKQQAQAYQDNPDLMDAITDRIDNATKQADNELDSQMINDFNDGKVRLSQFLAYAATVLAKAPGTDRATKWQKNIQDATLKGVGDSLSYRYDLTMEYAKLEQFLKSGPPSSGGGGGSAHTVLVSDGKGGWKTKTTYTGGGGTSASYQAWQLQAAQARERMKSIQSMVATLPGGWVTADDMIANLQQQQAGTVKGTSAWLSLQSQIDNYTQAKETMQLLSQEGIKISYPPVETETAKDVTVGPTEIPVVGVAPTYPGGGGARGGGGGGARGGGGGQLTYPTPTAPSQARQGPLLVQTGVYAGPSTSFGPSDVTPIYASTGIPAGMSANEWDKVYAGFSNAIRNGEAEFVDPVTGTTYLIPAEPEVRLAMINAMDQSNLNLKYAQLQIKAGTSGEASAGAAYQKAISDHGDNAWYVADTAVNQGPYFETAPNQNLEVLQKGKSIESQTTTRVYAEGTGETLVAATPESEMNIAQGGKLPANWLAMGVDLVNTTQTQYKRLMNEAQGALDRGDVDAAYSYQRQAAAMLQNPKLQDALSFYSAVAQQFGGDVPSGVKGDVSLLTSLSENGTLTWTDELAKYNQGLTDLFSPTITDPNTGEQVPNNNAIIKTTASGAPVMDDVGGGIQLNDGIVAVYNPKGNNGEGQITFQQSEYAGAKVNGQPSILPGHTQALFMIGNKPVNVQVPTSEGTAFKTTDPNTKTQASYTGKMMHVRLAGVDYNLVENPFSPGSWVQLSGNEALVLSVPKNATIATAPSNDLGATDPAHPQYLFSAPIYDPGTGAPVPTGTGGAIGAGQRAIYNPAPGSGSTKYVAAWNPDTGSYQLWQTDANGAPTILIPSVLATKIMKDQGFGFQTSTMTNGQNLAYLWGQVNGGSAMVGQDSQIEDFIIKKSVLAQSVNLLTGLPSGFRVNRGAITQAVTGYGGRYAKSGAPLSQLPGTPGGPGYTETGQGELTGTNYWQQIRASGEAPGPQPSGAPSWYTPGGEQVKALPAVNTAPAISPAPTAAWYTPGGERVTSPAPAPKPIAPAPLTAKQLGTQPTTQTRPTSKVVAKTKRVAF